MEIRICKKCNQTKSISDFKKYSTFCLPCDTERKKNYMSKYRQINKSAISLYNKEYRLKNKEKISLRCREYRKNNIEKFKKYSKERGTKWYHKNKEKVIERKKKYIENKRKTDPIFKLKESLSARIRDALKSRGFSKNLKTMDLLGCSIDFFKTHIQSLFLEGMNWNNYGFGNDKWHIDHIIPCRAFSLEHEDQQRKCFHYTNLRPLWQSENLSKLDILPNGQQARKMSKEEIESLALF
jgi:hypothetical protein